MVMKTLVKVGTEKLGFTLEAVPFDEALHELLETNAALAASMLMAGSHEADTLFFMTQERVPRRTHELAKSGRVEGPDMDSDYVGFDIAYGGPAGSGPGQTVDVDYAVWVHEDLETYHPHGQAKYVESVLDEEVDSGQSQARVAEEVKKRMGW